MSPRSLNVFVLNTGRCGSTTFARACTHATNYTAAHESRAGIIGPSRLAYPTHHIEVDNRLAWFLGRLDETYGDEVDYVHLTRDRQATGESLARRYPVGIIKAYRAEVHIHAPEPDLESLGLDFVDTVNANIRMFLRDKSRVMDIQMETMGDALPSFWEWIGAEGDLDAARAECDVRHNTAEDFEAEQAAKRARRDAERRREAPTVVRSVRKIFRVVKKLPRFVRSA